MMHGHLQWFAVMVPTCGMMQYPASWKRWQKSCRQVRKTRGPSVPQDPLDSFWLAKCEALSSLAWLAFEMSWKLREEVLRRERGRKGFTKRYSQKLPSFLILALILVQNLYSYHHVFAYIGASVTGVFTDHTLSTKCLRNELKGPEKVLWRERESVEGSALLRSGFGVFSKMIQDILYYKKAPLY